MRRMPTIFYKELHELRSAVGDVEYDRNKKLLKPTMDLITRHLTDDEELLREAANQILDNAEKADDDAKQGIFPYEDHVSLGEKKRIKRGSMNLDQHMRRKRVIDKNKTGQDRAWAAETEDLNLGIDALQGKPAKTKREDVLTEDGKPVVRSKSKKTEPVA